MQVITPGSLAVFKDGLEGGTSIPCEAPIISLDAYYTDPEVLGFYAVEEEDEDILCL